MIAHLWAACWSNFVIVLSHNNPEFPVPNPMVLTSDDCGGPSQIIVGKTDKADWQARAENNAAVCELLAGEGKATGRRRKSGNEC